MHLAEPNRRADKIEETISALREIFNKAWAEAQIDKAITEAKKPVPPARTISFGEEFFRNKLAEAKSRYDEYDAASSLCGMHPAFGQFFHRGGLDTYMFLYRMGTSLLALKGQGLLDDLIGRLRDENQFEGACAELNMLADWIATGVKVERHVNSAKGKTGQKNCDLKISDGKDVIFLEIKRLEKSATNKKRSALSDSIFRHMPWAEGVPLDMKAEADKVMRSARKAAEQVPAGGPGVVMISAHGNAALTVFGSELPELIVQRFEKHPSDYTDISGILILRSMFFPEHPERGEVQIGTYVPNPNGPRLSMTLLKRGVPNLQEWDATAKRIKVEALS